MISNLHCQFNVIPVILCTLHHMPRRIMHPITTINDTVVCSIVRAIVSAILAMCEPSL